MRMQFLVCGFLRKCGLTSITILSFMSFSSVLVAQEKYEQESRIRSEDVPQPALMFMDSSVFSHEKIKWFKEEGLEKTSFEAKFRSKKVWYSIEFDSLGIVEDIEMEVEFEALNAVLKERISSHLGESCTAFSIEKIQIQYSGENLILFSCDPNKASEYEFVIRYEVVVKCRQDRNVELMEYLFNDQGQPILVSKIVLKNSSHLEY